MIRAEALFRMHQNELHRRTDRMFAVLMAIQYVAGIVAALWISPRTWAGAQSSVHVHVWAAAGLGAVILSLPIALALALPGRTLTRHVIAVGQMLDSALLIHLSGGRIETHFHIFGSLAFLGFYRDWRVLISASAVVALDHFTRGVFWPESVFGVLAPTSWRWIEHTAWVVFEDVFIIIASGQSIREMREIAERRAMVEQIAEERGEHIAELQAARAQLKDALESTNAFISICGHELKTPLTTMSLQAQLTKRVLQAGPSAARPAEQIAMLVDQSEAQVKRLLRLVQDMLDQTRIQKGKLEITPESLDLTQLVAEVFERCRPQAEAAGCTLFLDGCEPVTGSWDRFRIEQVVTNLIINAIKYGARKPVEVSLTTTGDTARVRVKDHGIGIAEDDLSRIFRQFERVGDTQHAAGLGLGLYISQTIAEKHGGMIRVESAPGAGSTFTLELPIREAAARPAPLKMQLSERQCAATAPDADRSAR